MIEARGLDWNDWNGVLLWRYLSYRYLSEVALYITFPFLNNNNLAFFVVRIKYLIKPILKSCIIFYLKSVLVLNIKYKYNKKCKLVLNFFRKLMCS